MELISGRDYYSCYSFYDEKGRRLSGYGARFMLQGGEEQLRIIIFSCHPKDRFSKKKGIELYKMIVNAGYNYPDGYCPLLVSLPLLDHIHPKKQFLQYMEDKFFKKEVLLMEQDILVRESDERIGRMMGKPRVVDDWKMDMILNGLKGEE